MSWGLDETVRLAISQGFYADAMVKVILNIRDEQRYFYEERNARLDLAQLIFDKCGEDPHEFMTKFCKTESGHLVEWNLAHLAADQTSEIFLFFVAKGLKLNKLPKSKGHGSGDLLYRALCKYARISSPLLYSIAQHVPLSAFYTTAIVGSKNSGHVYFGESRWIIIAWREWIEQRHSEGRRALMIFKRSVAFGLHRDLARLVCGYIISRANMPKSNQLTQPPPPHIAKRRERRKRRGAKK